MNSDNKSFPSRVQITNILRIIINTSFLIIGVLLLIKPALENGFPLLHHDSGAYLLEGYKFRIPVSRPITYCLFVRYVSQIYSLWVVVIAQALMTYWIIWMAVNTLVKKQKIAWLTFISVAVLSTITGISYYVSQIMPDIFMPLALIGIFVMLVREKIPWHTLILLSLIIWLSLIVHLSNLPVLTAVFIVLLTFSMWIKKTFRIAYSRKVITILVVLVISWITNPALSSVYGEGFRISNSSGIVFFSRLLQAGAAQKYIHDKCDAEPEYYLCQQRDVIDSYNSLEIFLWDTQNSFLYKHPCIEKGWDVCWRERNEEFSTVNQAILAHPPALRIYINTVFKDFFLQLKTFQLQTYVSFNTDSHMNYPLKAYYENDYLTFQLSRQFHTTLVFGQQNTIIRYTTYISLLFLTGLIIAKRKSFQFNSPFFLLLLAFFLSWLANAGLTSLFAVVANRFLGRFIWLLPFLVIILIYQYYNERENANNTQ
jgi:hypothetical protein